MKAILVTIILALIAGCDVSEEADATEGIEVAEATSSPTAQSSLRTPVSADPGIALLYYLLEDLFSNPPQYDHVVCATYHPSSQTALRDAPPFDVETELRDRFVTMAPYDECVWVGGRIHDRAFGDSGTVVQVYGLECDQEGSCTAMGGQARNNWGEIYREYRLTRGMDHWQIEATGHEEFLSYRDQ